MYISQGVIGFILGMISMFIILLLVGIYSNKRK